MAVTITNKVMTYMHPYCEYSGLSTDHKPSNAPVNSVFKELDTGVSFYFSDGTWNTMGISRIGGATIIGETLNVSTNGEYTPVAGKMFNKVNVNVPGADNTDLEKIIERDYSIAEIPNGITKIGDYAFYYYTNLGIIALPNGITSIGQSAFQYCANLALTTLPSSLTDIGSYAFYNCTKLESLTFMGKPTSIKSNSFERCKNLLDIYVPWAHGEVDNAPWGATNATIHYNWVGA